MLPTKCATITATIVVSPTASGSIGIGPNSFSDSRAVLEGDLIASSAPDLTALQSYTFTNITGNWTISDLASLDTLYFPLLADAENVYLSNLPLLSQVTTAETLDVTNVVISNTSLSSLPNLVTPTTDVSQGVASITNNNKLGDVALEFQELTSLTFTSNGNSVHLILSNLGLATTIEISNCSSLAFPILELVDSLILEGNNFTSFEAPQLSRIDSFSFLDNPNIESLAIPSLTSFSNLSIANNTALQQVEFTNFISPDAQSQLLMTLSGNFTK